MSYNKEFIREHLLTNSPMYIPQLNDVELASMSREMLSMIPDEVLETYFRNMTGEKIDLRQDGFKISRRLRQFLKKNKIREDQLYDDSVILTKKEFERCNFKAIFPKDIYDEIYDNFMVLDAILLELRLIELFV